MTYKHFLWDPAAVVILKALWTDGYHPSEIAHRVGRDEGSVRRKASELGLPNYPRRKPAPKPCGTWTDERVERLKKLYADGMTCARIAERLGGVTRNAVIGKVTRLGLPLRGKPILGRPRTYTMSAARKLADARKRQASFADKFWKWRQRVAPRFEAKQEPLPPVWPGDVGRVPFAETTNEHCMFIPGDPKVDSRVCGLPRVMGLSYCEGHAVRCYGSPELVRRFEATCKPAVKESVEA